MNFEIGQAVSVKRNIEALAKADGCDRNTLDLMRSLVGEKLRIYNVVETYDRDGYLLRYSDGKRIPFLWEGCYLEPYKLNSDDGFTANEYQDLAQRTCDMYSGDSPVVKLLKALAPMFHKNDIADFVHRNRQGFQLLNGVLGLNGEAGEVTDLLKKNLFQGHELDKDKIIEELGDVQWYVAEIASSMDVPLSEVMRRNIKKLKNRYPDGFDAERSVNRAKYEEYR